MKRTSAFSIATLALSAALCGSAAGQNQNTVSYSYDNAGNRTARTTTGPDLTRSGGRTKAKSSTKRFITMLPSGTSATRPDTTTVRRDSYCILPSPANREADTDKKENADGNLR